MPQPIVTCDNLVKIYKVADLEVVALQGLDLEVAAERAQPAARVEPCRERGTAPIARWYRFRTPPAPCARVVGAGRHGRYEQEKARRDLRRRAAARCHCRSHCQ